ncbi:MAG: hypothetical protein DCO99_12650, partial [Synechococcus sp. XM-24]
INEVDDSPRRIAGGVFDLTVFEDAPSTSLELEGIDYNPGGSGNFIESDQTIKVYINELPVSSLGDITRANGSYLESGEEITIQELRGLRFNASKNAFGTSRFSFAVEDSNGNVTNEQIIITVRQLEDSPERITGGEINFTVKEDAPLTSMRLGGLSYKGEQIQDGYEQDPKTGESIPKYIDAPLTYTITELPNEAIGTVTDINGVDISLGTTTLSAIKGLHFKAKENAFTTEQTYGTFRFTVSDGVSTPTEETIFIHVLSENDAPVATFSTAQNTTEDATYLTGQLTSSDADSSDSVSYSLLGQPIDGLTINNDGSWSFDPSSPSYQGLAAEQARSITVN